MITLSAGAGEAKGQTFPEDAGLGAAWAEQSG